MLVAKDNKSKCMFAIPLPMKGVDVEDWSNREVLKILKCVGYSEITLKSDQEVSIATVLDGVQAHKGAGAQNAIELSPVGDSRSNGLVENANQTLQCQVRTMAEAPECKVEQKLDGNMVILPWLMIHAA